jgi:hypothetical protein
MKITNSTSFTAIAALSMMATSSAFVHPTARTSVAAASAAVASRVVATSSSTSSSTQRGMFNFFGTKSTGEYPIYAEESVMAPKAHGTSDAPVQPKLRWNCDYQTADRICNFNRHYAEYAGYWQTTDFLNAVKQMKEGETMDFYDSVTGALLFTAPQGRTMAQFLKESQSHGWPSFRDEEVVWDYVRCLKNGECISTTGTHLVRDNDFRGMSRHRPAGKEANKQAVGKVLDAVRCLFCVGKSSMVVGRGIHIDFFGLG